MRIRTNKLDTSKLHTKLYKIRQFAVPLLFSCACYEPVTAAESGLRDMTLRHQSLCTPPTRAKKW